MGAGRGTAMRAPAAPRRLAVAVFLAAAFAPGAAIAQSGPDAAAVAGATERYFSEAVDAGQFPGAVVAVVLGGEVVHLGGYGAADLEAGRPMNPENTLIRLGAVSGVLTAMVALAAEAQGILDLHEDLREPLRAAGIGLEPLGAITLHHLLTHTSGLGDRLLGQYERRTTEAKPLVEFLAGNPPLARLEPDQAVIPSDLALSLVGAALEAVSAEPFAALAERLVFARADLGRTSLDPRLPPNRLGELALGHRWTGEGLQPVPYDTAQAAPALGGTATADDMGRLLAMLLNDGIGASRLQVLSPRSIELLTSRQATNYGDAQGRAYGFSEGVAAGRVAWSQDGAAPGFTAHLSVVPELGLGVFVGASAGATVGLQGASEAARAVRGFSEALIAELWPAAPSRGPELIQLAPDDRADYGGYYRDVRVDPDTPLKVLGLIEQEPVAMLSDVRLRFRGETYRKIALDTFQSEVAPARFARFLRDDVGGVSHLLLPDSAFERVGAWESARVHIFMAGLALGLIALGTIIVLMAVLLRWWGRLANTFGLVAGLGGGGLAVWLGWQVSAFNLDVALTQGLPGIPVSAPVWMALAAAAALSFLMALFGRGIRGWNRWGLVFIAAGWGAYAPVLSTWRLLA